MNIKNFAITWISFSIFILFGFSASASFPFCSCDFNDDQDFDGVELSIIATDFNQANCNGDCQGDFDKDGIVDSDDLNVFSAAFGRTGPNPSGTHH